MEFRLYDHLDYREVIKGGCQQKGLSQKTLANSAHIHTSYFSRVMGEGADFSADQLFLIGRDLQFNEEELQYFLLLGDYGRSANSIHKSYLKEKILDIQKNKLKIINNLQGVNRDFEYDRLRAEQYYMESVTAKVLMLLTIKKFRENPALICRQIFISENKLNYEIEKLARLNLVEKGKSGVKLLQSFVHIDHGHPFNVVNNVNWRLESIQYMNKRDGSPTDYHFSALFSSNEQVKVKARDLFKKYIQEVQKMSKDYPSVEDAYYLGFDLFDI